MKLEVKKKISAFHHIAHLFRILLHCFEHLSRKVLTPKYCWRNVFVSFVLFTFAYMHEDRHVRS